MSLKDRLNTSKTNTPLKAIQEEPRYYESSDIANNSASLGVIDVILADEELNSIYVNGAKNIYVEKNGKVHKSASVYRDNVQLENTIKRNAQHQGVELDDINPYIKFNYEKGINVSATLPPLSNNAVMFIKCYRDKFANLQTLQEQNSISKEISLVLETLMSYKCNVIIAGEKNTLKTTLLSSLSKKIPVNSRAVLIDYLNEIEIKNQNLAGYNFSQLKDKKTELEIIDSVMDSNPDKIFINDCEKDIFSHITNKALTGFKGIITTLRAAYKEEVVQKIISYCSNKNAPEGFDIVIYTKTDSFGKRIISSISQIKQTEQGYELEDIFFLNDSMEHCSTGIIPNFKKEPELNSIPVNSNIFNQDYKHTYTKIPENTGHFVKKANIEIIKKFKKDLQESKNELNEQYTIEKPSTNTNEELMKKAQEKFNELRKNIQEDTPKESENDAGKNENI